LWEYSVKHHETPAKVAVRVGLPTYTAQEVLDVRIDWDIGKQGLCQLSGCRYYIATVMAKVFSIISHGLWYGRSSKSLL
jgi:hypothetical protein